MKTPEPSDASGNGSSRALYAVVRHGGHQYRVRPGDRLLVDRIPSEVGSVVGLEPVLLLADSDGVQVETAILEGVRIAATVAGHRRGRKLRVFTFKPKKRHRRTLGFRAELTELVVDRFLAKGEPLPEPVEIEEAEPGDVAVEQAEIEPEDLAVEPAGAEPEPVRPRRRTSRVGAAAATAPPTPAPEPEAEVEIPAPRRRRAAATAVAVEAESAPAAEAAAPAVPEATASRPSRRGRAAAAGVEAEPAEPKGATPPPVTPGPARRRAVRKTSPPEAGE
jgi:large subunit ribosomal protein L21